MFGSSSVSVHLARGAIGAGAIAIAMLWGGGMWWLSVMALVVAVIALGGCPMCWVVGLVDTWTRRPSAGACCTIERTPARPGPPAKDVR